MPSLQVVVAEWLRRLTRNQLGSARAGSNPADDAFLLYENQQNNFNKLFIMLIKTIVNLSSKCNFHIQKAFIFRSLLFCQ